VFLFLAFFLWQATFELAKIDIQGLTRFTPDAVLQTIGLKPGANVGKASFDDVCQKLVRSGLFEGCDWKYMPTSASGIALTLQLKEAQAPQTVRLTLPGVSESQLWDWLRQNEPLVQKTMPASDDAIEFYTQAIRRFLKQDVVSSIDTNLETKENILVFRPANLPKIESIKFEGTKVIDAAVLEKIAAPIAQGMLFTEFDVTQILDLNVRPIYEKLGRLNVKFPAIKAAGGAVTVQVDEGGVYKVGKVTATGGKPSISVGEIADWPAIRAALDAVTGELRNQGHLSARYKVDRTLNDSAGTVDIKVAYEPGKRFTFGALKLNGLNAAQESAVRRIWMLPAGAPMNAAYVDEFIKAAFGKIGEEYSGVASQMEPVGESAVDVVITFRRR